SAPISTLSLHDALPILARFAAVLGFGPDDATRKAATAMAEQIDNVSRERIRDELDRLITGAHAARGLDLLVETGLADRFLPELRSEEHTSELQSRENLV